MRLIRFRMKILAASDTESDYAIRCTWVLSLHLYGGNSACITCLQKETNIEGHAKNLSSTLKEEVPPL